MKKVNNLIESKNLFSYKPISRINIKVADNNQTKSETKYERFKQCLL
ncbi:hypothetical protein [Moraxella lacunata]